MSGAFSGMRGGAPGGVASGAPGGIAAGMLNSAASGSAASSAPARTSGAMFGGVFDGAPGGVASGALDGVAPGDVAASSATFGGAPSGAAGAMPSGTTGVVSSGATNGALVERVRVPEARSSEAEGGVLLDIIGLCKSYARGSCALHGVSFRLRKGELVSVIGPSGAGKSTLLRCINRMIEASSGQIVFDGRDVRQLRRRELRMLRRRISMIFQHYNLVHRLTTIENVLHGRLGYKSTLAGMLGSYSEGEKQKALNVLAQLGIIEFAYVRTDQLSGGQKQRVGIARALVQDPLLVLCDEPVASLDPKSARVIMGYLRAIADSLGITCLVNLHQVDYALEYSDRIIALRSGEMVYDGSPAELSAGLIGDLYGMNASVQPLPVHIPLGAPERLSA
jgi:phosphonate transport system ATP-binding protein